eukprot:3149033-Lingulodinium_polyedra.AAC.1
MFEAWPVGLMRAHGGSMDSECWDALIWQLRNIMTVAEQLVRDHGVVNMVFWCKVGRRRSYALLVFCLMWGLR